MSGVFRFGISPQYRHTLLKITSILIKFLFTFLFKDKPLLKIDSMLYRNRIQRSQFKVPKTFFIRNFYNEPGKSGKLVGTVKNRYIRSKPSRPYSPTVCQICSLAYTVGKMKGIFPDLPV